MKKIKKIKKRHILISFIILVIAIAIMLNSYWLVIFQKGNPIPYLNAILKLNDNQTYLQVHDNNPNIFLTKRDNYDEFHRYIENKYLVSFQEQMGSGYIFSSAEKEIIVSSEVYMRYFIVWTINIK